MFLFGQNILQDRMMKELHSQGKTTEDIVEVLKRTPIHPRVVPAIKAAHALGYVSKPSINIYFLLSLKKKNLFFYPMDLILGRNIINFVVGFWFWWLQV